MNGICERADVSIGGKVQDFTFATYNPAQEAFEDCAISQFGKADKWLVLIFYPANFSFICPTELADIAAVHETLQSLGVEIVSVSTDTKFAHLAWRQSEQLLHNVRFHMGADPSGTLSRYFGVYDEKEGTALRGTFIISPDGILTGSEVSSYNMGRNAEELVRKMHAYAYLRKHPNEVCPAAWQVGQKTITPSADLVGNMTKAAL